MNIQINEINVKNRGAELHKIKRIKKQIMNETNKNQVNKKPTNKTKNQVKNKTINHTTKQVKKKTQSEEKTRKGKTINEQIKQSNNRRIKE